jgi:SpoVK/Ycf46/Vps4 family AAA+-type ATPase
MKISHILIAKKHEKETFFISKYSILNVQEFSIEQFFFLKDIYLHDPSVTWDSIIGLDAAKRTVKEAVVYPIRV